MLNSTIRTVFVACIAASTLFAWLPQSEAAGTCFAPAPAVVTYSRPYAAGRISWLPSYGVRSVGNPMVAGSYGYSVYRPVYQTAYRPVYQAAYRPVYQAVYRPVTAYMPTTGFDPGSSCVTTSVSKYRPGQPLRNVFRVLLPPYGPRLQTVCYTPRAAYSPISYGAGMPTSCSSYSPISSTSFYSTTCDPCSQGSACVQADCGTTGSACVSKTYGPAATTPPSNSAVPGTYKQESQPQLERRLKPSPDPSIDPATLNKPKRIDPESRTAMAPVRQAVRYQPVSLAGSTAPAIDVGGWRASRD